MVTALAGFIAPEAAVVIAAEEVLTATAAAAATVAFVQGDLVPAGKWLVVKFLEERYPAIPWGLVP